MSWEVEFFLRSCERRRTDGERNWPWYEKAVAYNKHFIRLRLRRWLRGAVKGANPQLTLDWLWDNSENLWMTRSMLADDLSRLLFDSSLLLRMSGHRHFYFPRIDFEDLVEMRGKERFNMRALPKDYLGLPLNVCDLVLRMPGSSPANIRLVCTEQLLDGINSYRQYLTTRNSVAVAPRHGEVVFDCGACIGDFSLLFAAMVGDSGQVHAFEPIPLHNRYCALQAQLNPALAATLCFNELAVGARTSTASQPLVDCARIDPGHRVDEDSFDCTSLDDYADTKHLRQIDFIKMDIEGAEMDAIEGARNIIRTYKPRLAISGYHKPADLWEIPQKLKSLNSGYELTFGHHSPVQWESVFYARDQV